MKSASPWRTRTNPAVADEFYDRFQDLMWRKGTAPPYPASSRACSSVTETGRPPLQLRVRDEAGRVLATGLFPHYDRTVYFWAGASWQKRPRLNPNDFLHGR